MGKKLMRSDRDAGVPVVPLAGEKNPMLMQKKRENTLQFFFTTDSI